MSKSNKEKYDRLKLMAENEYDNWDLSENDIEAIKFAVEQLKKTME